MNNRVDPSVNAPGGKGVVPPRHARGREPLEITPLRKAAILLVSLEQPLASQVLAHLERQDVEAVTLEIARLEGVDPSEQQAVLEEFYGLGVRRLRFVFEDLVKLDDKEIREAFHQEDAPTWALALAGTSKVVRSKVLEALEPADSEALSRRIERIGPFRLDECEAAQSQVAETLRVLHDHGHITLPDPNGQEVLLV